jgi:hypothetical protein
VTGEEAHIVSSREDGPRYRPLEAHEVDDLDNFILLCPEDHTVVDKQVDSYPEDDLRRRKREHEEWVRSVLEPVDHGALYTSDSDGALVVGIVREIAHNLDVGLLVLEVKVSVRNQTFTPKSADFIWHHEAGEALDAPAGAVTSALSTLRFQSPPLAPYTLIEPGESVAGWITIYIPNPAPGIPAYEVAASDESGTRYSVSVPPH